MKGVIVVFGLGGEMTRAERSRFFRELYGYVDRSNHGRYRYRRKGLLSSIPHFSPARSVVVVKKGHGEELVGFLRERGVTVFARDIDLLREDLEKMR